MYSTEEAGIQKGRQEYYPGTKNSHYAVAHCRTDWQSVLEAVRKGGQAPYILYQLEAWTTTSGSQSPFPDSQLQ